MASELEVGKVTSAGDLVCTRGIVKKSTGSGNTEIKIENDSASNAAVLTLEGKRTSDNDCAQILIANSGENVAAIKGFRSGANDAGKLEIQTSASGSSGLTTRLTLASTGAVSIPGAAAAASKLTVGNIHGELILNNTSGTSGSTVLSQTYNGSTAELRIGSNVSGTGSSAMNVITGDAGLVKFNGGISFGQTNTSATGATATGTTLDHYEEGTWTCTLGGVTGGNTTGYYTRVGDVVTVWFYSGSMASDGSAASISGLPFAVSGAAYGGFFCYHNTYVPTANSGYFSVNNTSGYFTAANTTSAAMSANATGRYLMFTGVYKVA